MEFPYQFPLKYRSPEQRSTWQAAADRDGRSLSDWIRRELDAAAARKNHDEAAEVAGQALGSIQFASTVPGVELVTGAGVIVGEPISEMVTGPEPEPRHLAVVHELPPPEERQVRPDPKPTSTKPKRRS